MVMLKSLLEWVVKPRWNRRKITRLGNRQAMTPTEFYETFFADSGLPEEIVVELRDEIGCSVEIPPELLRPQDGFRVELADDLTWGIDGGEAELMFAAERRQEKWGVRVDLAKIQTVEDYIRTFGSLAPSSASTHS